MQSIIFSVTTCTSSASRRIDSCEQKSYNPVFGTQLDYGYNTLKYRDVFSKWIPLSFSAHFKVINVVVWSALYKWLEKNQGIFSSTSIMICELRFMI